MGKEDIEKDFLVSIRKRYFKFVGQISIRKESVEIMTQDIFEGKRDKGKHCMTYLSSLSKWNKV